MNYLAHSYLSFDDEELLFGNFIGDFVKGRYNPDLPERVWKGVELHRQIDHFTDTHKATLESKNLIRNELKLASGIFVDMIFDHVLAENWDVYSPIELELFTQETYQKIEKYKDFHPQKFSQMFRYMKNDDWLNKYSNSYDMERFLKGMSRRLKVKNELDGSFILYTKYKQEFDAHFKDLFKDLIEMSKNY